MAMMANLFAQNVVKIPAIDARRKQESLSDKPVYRTTR